MKIGDYLIKEELAISAGGPGSGCQGPNCGRHVLYHGTTVENARKIAKQGLKPGKSAWGTKTSYYHGGGKVYFTNDLNEAHNFGFEAQTAPKRQQIAKKQAKEYGEKYNPKEENPYSPDEYKGTKYGVVRVEVPDDIYKKMQKDPESPNWKRFSGSITPDMVSHVSIYKSGDDASMQDSKVVSRVKGGQLPEEKTDQSKDLGWSKSALISMQKKYQGKDLSKMNGLEKAGYLNVKSILKNYGMKI